MFESMSLIPAKLKTVNTAAMIAGNSVLANSGIMRFSSIQPYIYNRVGFCTFNNGRPAAFTTVNNDLSTSFQIATVGTYQYQNLSNRNVANLEDFTIHITTEKIGDVYGTRVQGEVLTIAAGINDTFTPSVFEGYVDGVTRLWYAETPETGKYNEWYRVKRMDVYNRPWGSTADRVFMRSCYPVVPISGVNLQGLKMSGSGALTSLVNIAGDFEITTPLYLDVIDATYARFMSYMFRYIMARRITTTIGGRVVLRSLYEHNSNTNSSIKFVGWDTGTDTHIGTWSIGGKTFTTLPQYATIAFKTQNDILSLFADWGINTATFDFAQALRGARDTFPDAPVPDDEFVPDVGDKPSGYPDNPIIPNIPAYPDNTSDKIPNITPNITALQACNAYALNSLNVRSFLNWLMTDNFFTNISELFNDKISALNDIKLYPFDFVTHDATHAQQQNTLTIANVTMSDIDCYAVLNGYNMWFSGGSINLLAYYGDYNDYYNVSYSIYIPYVGIVPIDSSFVVNALLSIDYAVDILTGSATVVVRSNGVVIKTMQANVAQSIPITFTNTNQQRINQTLSALSIATDISSGIGSLAIGDYGGAANAGVGAAVGIFTTAARNPYRIQHIGAVSSGTGLILPQQPFLIISRKQIAKYSSNYAIGTPASFYGKLSAFSGTGLIKAKTNVIESNATTAEKQEIFAMLNDGIII